MGAGEGMTNLWPDGRIGGLPVYYDANMVERVLHAKSPSRAKRRARRGYPQHYAWRPMKRVIQAPAGLFMHPAIAREMGEASNG
jgi:hypothetical protein